MILSKYKVFFYSDEEVKQAQNDTPWKMQLDPNKKTLYQYLDGQLPIVVPKLISDENLSTTNEESDILLE